MTDILLSAYNGGRFLAVQFESLLNQTCRDIRIVVRDDGSSDFTPEIIKEYAEKYPEKIIVLNDRLGNLGVTGSFFELLRNCGAEYAMFCDQDDFWLPEKVEITLKAMKQAEEKYKNLPVLVHTDLSVTDENLQITSRSMFRSQRLNPANADDINILILENVVTGCTVMMNKKLADLLKNVPKEAVLHDWWAALTALKHGGRVVFADTATILYRQHGKNTVGAESFGLQSVAGRLKNIARHTKAAKRGCAQAAALGIKLSTAEFIIKKTLLLAKRV